MQPTSKQIIYDIDVSRLLRSLYDGRLAMQDPMGASGYILACKTDAFRADALSKLATAATRAEKAREASIKGNISGAFNWWRLVYGCEFPTYYY